MAIESKKEELNEVAMKVILHAGDAKIAIDSALEKINSFDFNEAEKFMENANAEIVKAHEVQTLVIQSEASGEIYPNSLLFNHAQDTMMTTMVYYDMAVNLLKIAKTIENRIDSINNAK